MMDRLVSSIIVFLCSWLRVFGKRLDFTSASNEYRRLITTLEMDTSLDDAKKNDALHRAVVDMLLKHSRMRQ